MKILLKNLIASFIILICFSIDSYGQVEDEIRNSFNKNQQDILHEKLFVHTDKSKYLTGEILWFKIYNVNVESNQPLNTSKVAYVEILDNNHVPIMQIKVALTERGGNGSVFIPASISNGNYKLRAYTNWMKNFSVYNYFEKDITIINPSKSVQLNQSKQNIDYDIQFFPEGGSLVNGLASKVGFKVVGPDGNGLQYRGAIINQNKDTIIRFKPLKFGMGNFILKPNLKDVYKAVIYIGTDKKQVIKDLPAINKQGYIIQLKDHEKQLEVTVKSNLDKHNVYLFVHTKSVSKFMQSRDLVNGNAVFFVDKDLLGEGVSHFTVFNNAKQPVCERLYFTRPGQHAFITATVDEKQYGIRKNVKADISVNDLNNKPLVSNLSMSVYQTDSVQNIEPSNIINYLWLTSDLKGHIESPDYYFNNQDTIANQAIDNLMLTQGWSRFRWDEVLKNPKPTFSFLPEYTGHLITAKLTNTITSKAEKNITTYLSVPGKRLQLYVSKSDSTGKLIFNTKDLYGPGEIVVQTNAQKDSTYNLNILSPFSENYSKNIIPDFTISPEIENTLALHHVAVQVQNLYSSDKQKQFYKPQIDSSSFYGQFFVPYKLDDYTRFTTMEEVLREYVKSVIVAKKQKKYQLKIIGEKTVLEDEPIVILDGVPVFDMDKVMAIDPLKVQKLELVKSGYFWQATEFQGILNFTTYKGDLAGYEFDPKTVIVDYEGLQLEREFYSPEYETTIQVVNRLPDFRNVLYWSPSVSTDESGKIQLTFYTSDIAGNYVGIIQGLTSTGQPVYQSFKFEVKQGYSASMR